MRIAVYPGSFDPVTNGHCGYYKAGSQNGRSPGDRSFT